jgi:hypothetical protein
LDENAGVDDILYLVDFSWLLDYWTTAMLQRSFAAWLKKEVYAFSI